MDGKFSLEVVIQLSCHVKEFKYMEEIWIVRDGFSIRKSCTKHEKSLFPRLPFLIGNGKNEMCLNVTKAESNNENIRPDKVL